jgi:signal transduction histidine kinase
MTTPLPPGKSTGLTRIFGWRRLLVTLAVSGVLGLVISPAFSTAPAWRIVGREMAMGLMVMVVYGLFEQWPQRLPAWVARWTLQVVAVAISVPLVVLAWYVASTPADALPFWHVQTRLNGFSVTTMTALIVVPWVAVAALFRRTEVAARHQALAFELEKSELERKAVDARLRLLTAQVEPHFLFNTLANVRELVDSRSPQASTVLDHLITYLRAAVPRLNDPATTVEQELSLVRAYLELMHLRMPDRLRFEVQADAAALALRCPPTMLLTLVENAVRHGIDPSEDGGRIDVCVAVRDGRCHVQVCDTGVGMRGTGGGLGTGLAALRERLELTFGADAKLELHALSPAGTRAEVEFPAAKPA